MQYTLPTTDVLNVTDIKRLIQDNIDESTEYIGLSSQMHGFVGVDENNKQITDFVTWKHKSSGYILDNPVFDDFDRTGLQKRADLPINNLYCILETMKNPPKYVRFRHITEAILDVCVQKTHATMACGSGFYDLSTKSYVTEYIDFFKTLGVTVAFDDVVSSICISGYMIVNGRSVPVYTGIGDFQASVLGCNVAPKMLYVNMSTGSQIALISESMTKSMSCRPFFNNQFLHCKTHIPCGRVWSNLYYKIDFNLWEGLKSITEDMFYASTTSIPFSDSEITADDLVPLFRGFIFQYIDSIRNEKFEFNSIFLSGGIPKKIPLIKTIFEREFGCVYLHNDNDDSIRGIQLLLQTMHEKFD